MTFRYVAIAADSWVEISRMVNNYIAAGWVPLGGVSVAYVIDADDIHHEKFAQALLLEKADDAEHHT